MSMKERVTFSVLKLVQRFKCYMGFHSILNVLRGFGIRVAWIEPKKIHLHSKFNPPQTHSVGSVNTTCR